MFVLRKNDIKSFPFEEAKTLSGETLEEWSKTMRLSYYSSWMLPQIVAHYGNWEVVNEKVSTEGQAPRSNPLSTLKHNCTSDWEIGLWRVCTQLNRGRLVTNQNRPPNNEYSSLVPLILAGLKKFKGIKYSSWATEGLEHLMGKQLFTAANFKLDSSLDKSRLLELRDLGLSKSQHSKPTSAWRLSGLKDTELGGLPNLTVTMLTQTWIAHPSLRTSYMILDLNDWDNMPEPLVDTKVIASSDPFSDLPWMN